MGKATRKNSRGMLLILALALLFILTLLASSLIFLSQSSRTYVMRAYRENLEEQCINVVQVEVGKELQGPLPSPDPAQNSWSSVKPDINPSDLPNPIPPMPSPSPSPLEVTPEGNRKFKLTGEVLSLKIPDTAGAQTGNVPQVGYQDSDKFPKLGADSVPPWHSLAYIATMGGKKYKTMYGANFPFGVYAPNGSINLWSAKGYMNPSITDMTKNNWNDNLAYSGVPVNMYAKDRIKVQPQNSGGNNSSSGRAYPFGKAYVASKDGKIIISGGGVGYKQEFDRDYSLIYLNEIVNAYRLISNVTVDKSKFVYCNDGKTLDVTNFFSLLISKELPSTLEHILSMQQAKSFPFFTMITMKEDCPGVEFRVFFHVPDLTDGSTVPSPNDQKKIKAYTDALKEIAAPWADFPTKDNGDINWNKVSSPYDNQSFYQAQKALIKYINDNWNDILAPSTDTNYQYALGAFNTMKDTINNKFYQEFHIEIDYGKISEKYTIDGKSESEAKSEAIGLFYTTHQGVDPDKVVITVNSNKHWLIKKSDLRTLYGFEKVLASYWDRQVENLKKGHGTEPADINKLTMEDEINLLGSTKDKNGCDGTNYYKLLKKAASFFKDIITFHVKNAMKDLFKGIRLVHFEGGPYDLSVARDKGNGKLTVSMTGDWTVPKGRTLKLDCNMNLRGDLWIQDGGALFITGFLNVQSPGDVDSSDDPGADFKKDIQDGLKAVFKPTGRVFLGKGSTVLVGGDFTCTGSPYRGSVIVDSEVGRVNYITSAIISKGNVTIPHGVVPGVSLSSVGNMLQGKNSALGKFLNDVEYIPSQVAKVFGPFHRRYCCIAEIPDPWVILDIPIIDVFIFFPMPVSEVHNMNIEIFRVLTYGYTVVLNATMGENLFTDSSWWVMGQGAVPMLPKVGGIQLLPEFFEDFSDFKDFAGEILDDIKSFLSTATLENLAETLLIKLLNKVICEAVSNILSFGSSFISNAISNMLGNSIENLLDNLLNVSDKINPLDQIKKTAEKYEDFMKEKLSDELTFKFYETSGALIYSDKKLKIGDENQEKNSCLFASGLFVAYGDIESYADRTVGCMISIDGSIKAKDFLFYPYFTKASLNIPDNKSLWEALLNPLMFSTNKYPMEIGVKLQHITGEGWGR